MARSSQMVPDDQAPQRTEELVSHLHCYTCGNDIEESVTIGSNTALVRIRAAVCRFRGERVLDLPNRVRLEQVRHRFARGDIADFEPVGVTSYRVL